MDPFQAKHDRVKDCWESNADAWTALARAGYDVYRDCLNTRAFFAMLSYRAHELCRRRGTFTAQRDSSACSAS